MARARKSATKTKSFKVDFTGVEARKLVPEDDYLLKVEEITSEEGNEFPYFKFVFVIDDGKFEGQKLYYNASTSPNALWKLMALLEALGVEVPQDEFEIDPEEIVGKTMMGVVNHDTYEGKKQSKLVDFYAAEDEAGAKDEQKGKTAVNKEDTKGKKGAKKEPEKLDREDVEKMDRDELEELITEHKLDVDPDDFTKKQTPKMLAAVLEALEGEDLLEEPEPEPKGKKGAKDKDDAKGGKGKKLPKLAADDIQAMDEDDLGGVIEKYELEVDLDDFKTLRKKAAAVIDALEDKGMIEED